MIATLTGALAVVRTQAFQWAAAIASALAALLGFALFERRAGAAAVRTAELEREVADAHLAHGIAAEAARESEDEVLADLLRDARR